MSSSVARSLLWMITPSLVAVGNPSTGAQSRPSAISLMVKSNSLRATKSITAPCARLSSGCTATLAPTKPIFSDGLAAFSASATFTSDAKDGVEVCITHSS